MTPEVLLAPLMGIGKVTIDDFQPVARLTDDPLAITVRADAPWRTVEEFLAHGKANPGKLSISIAGNGTTHHVGAAALAQATGVQFTIVPYQGSAPAIMGVLSGDVQATTAAYAELSQHVQGGKLRTLAVMADKRVEGLAQVPTMKERGHDLQYSTWRAIGLPRNTPKPVVDQWRAVARNIAQASLFKDTMAKLSLTIDFADAPEFSAALARQAQDYRKLLTLLK
jgi:tripartite-type tricarboxylate transporter receptor subunit TctC